MAVSDVFSADFKDEPYWWIDAPRVHGPSHTPPESVDVAIIGSGVTGLNAARELARAGRSVLVFDAEELGIGGSSRNAGNIGRVLKYDFSKIKKLEGDDRAVSYYRELQAAYDTVEEVISSLGIQCHYKKNGRLILAYTEKQLRLAEAEAKLKHKFLDEDYEVLGTRDLRSELASDAFVGAVYLPNSASFHPALYHQGLITAAAAEGVEFSPFTLVESIKRNGDSQDSLRFSLETNKGRFRARDVIVATNGYSQGGVPGYFKRRLIPFDAYMIAISVPQSALSDMVQKDRVYIDANRNLNFFRRSPDNEHLLFGGRTGARRPKDLKEIARKLYFDACKLLPDLQKYTIARAWTGKCAGTFDLYPHIGVHDGIHYAAGYCFAGMPMGTYLGRKLAYGMIGKEGETIFRERSFPTMPGYFGSSWFMPMFMRYYDWLDRKDGGYSQHSQK